MTETQDLVADSEVLVDDQKNHSLIWTAYRQMELDYVRQKLVALYHAMVTFHHGPPVKAALTETLSVHQPNYRSESQRRPPEL